MEKDSDKELYRFQAYLTQNALEKNAHSPQEYALHLLSRACSFVRQSGD